MLHYKRGYNDEQAVCGATLYHGESTVFTNRVQCPACRAAMKASGERHETSQAVRDIFKLGK